MRWSSLFLFHLLTPSFVNAQNPPVPPVFTQLQPAPTSLAAASAACAGTTCYLNGGFGPQYFWEINTYSLNITASPNDPDYQWNTDYPQCWPIPECGGVGPGDASTITWDTTDINHHLLWASGGCQSSGANEFQPIAYLSYYDPYTGAWTVANNGFIPLGNQLDGPGVAYHSMLSINNTLYLLGGAIYVDNSDYEVSNLVLTFDANFPQGSSWIIKPELTLPVNNTMFGAAVIGSKIYITGGSPNWEPPSIGGQCANPVSPPDGPLSATYVLDTSETNPSWKNLQYPLQYPRCGLSLLADEINNKLYAIGGWINSASSKLENTGIIEMLDLNNLHNNTGWVLVHPPLPISSSFMAAAQLNYPPSVPRPPNAPFGFLSTGWNGAFGDESNFTWALSSPPKVSSM